MMMFRWAGLTISIFTIYDLPTLYYPHDVVHMRLEDFYALFTYPLHTHNVYHH